MSFPPVRTENLREAVQGLWKSLQEVEDYFTGNGSISERGKNLFWVTMYLKNEPTGVVQRTMRNFIRSYVKECGWTAQSVSFGEGAMHLKVCPRK
jgi:hypothetical protein